MSLRPNGPCVNGKEGVQINRGKGFVVRVFARIEVATYIRLVYIYIYR